MDVRCSLQDVFECQKSGEPVCFGTNGISITKSPGKPLHSFQTPTAAPYHFAGDEPLGAAPSKTRFPATFKPCLSIPFHAQRRASPDTPSRQTGRSLTASHRRGGSRCSPAAILSCYLLLRSWPEEERKAWFCQYLGTTIPKLQKALVCFHRPKLTAERTHTRPF